MNTWAVGGLKPLFGARGAHDQVSTHPRLDSIAFGGSLVVVQKIDRLPLAKDHENSAFAEDKP